MKKIAVLYRSCYGSAKQYAQWIAGELGADLYENKKTLNSGQLKAYDILIWGGGVYAGKVNGLEVVDMQASWMKEKKVVLFTCGVVDPDKESYVKRIHEDMENRISPSLFQHVKIFRFPGELDYTRLKFTHKMMMKSTYKMIQKSPEENRSEEDKKILESYGKVQGKNDRSKIAPLVSYVRGLAEE